MTIQSVEQRKAGDTAEAAGRKSPVAQPGTPASGKVSSEAPEAPKYTEAQLKAAVKAAEGRANVEKSVLEKERNQFKTQVASLTADLADNAKDIESLQGKYDDMAKDDPDRMALGKELKAARDERKQLKADRVTLDAERVELEPDRQERRNRQISDVAQEYELPAGATYDVLFDLADIAKAKTESEYRAIADKLWAKKAGGNPDGTKPADTPITTFSGKTKGGGSGFTREQLANMSPEEYAKNRETILEAQRQEQIK